MRHPLMVGIGVLAFLSAPALAGGDKAVQQQGAAAPGLERTAAGTGDTAGASTGTAATAVSADALMGKDVMGSDGASLGSVEDIILDPNSNEIRQLVLSSGGFLGIGAKQVAVDYADVTVHGNGDEVRVSSLTQSDIGDLPEFSYDDSMVSMNRRAGTDRPADGTRPAD